MGCSFLPSCWTYCKKQVRPGCSLPLVSAGEHEEGTRKAHVSFPTAWLRKIFHSVLPYLTLPCLGT
jgi:hypothetical protein